MPMPDQSQSNQVNYGENRKNLAAAAAGGRSIVFRVLFRRQGEGAARAGRKLHHRVHDRLAGGLPRRQIPNRRRQLPSDIDQCGRRRAGSGPDERQSPQTLRRDARSGRLHGGGDPPGGNVRAGGILVGNRQKRRRGPERESGRAENEIRDPRGQHDARARSIGRRDLHPVGRGDRRRQNRPLVLVERRAGLRKRIRGGRPGRVRTAVDGLRRLLSRRLRHCGRHLHAPRRQRKGRTAFAAPQRAVAGQRRRCPATANTRSTCARKRENTPTRPSRSAQATSPRAAGPPAPTGKPTKPPTSPRRDRSPSRPSAKAGK